MSKKEEIYSFLKKNKGKKFTGKQLRLIFGMAGSLHEVIRYLAINEKIKSKDCECGNCTFYWV